jgi:hypothetical protein
LNGVYFLGIVTLVEQYSLLAMALKKNTSSEFYGALGTQ